MGHIKKFNEHQVQGTKSSNSNNSDYLQNIKVVTVGDKEVAKQASELVGDGKEPNLFFVTSSNDYMFYDSNNDMQWYSDKYKEAPVKIESEIRVETFGPYEELKDAMKKTDELDLDQEVGPRHVMIEDRKTGTIFEKYLKAEKKIVWGDETNDDTKRFGY